MENASKALIIAGAILISITLISVGIMVLNGANNAVGQSVSDMDQYSKDMFNSKIEQYQGDSVSGSNVQALISQIISSNNSNYEKFNRQIGIVATGTATTSKFKTVGETDSNKKALYDTLLDQTTTQQDLAALSTATKAFATTAGKLRNAVNTAKKYTVTMEFNPATQLIDTVNITEQ